MKNLIAGGFGELTPDKQIIKNGIKDIISNNYKKFGYVNIETPAVELNEVLISKGGDEVSKQIFGLYGLKQGSDNLKSYSLHFDLTVPLARYIISHEDEIKFPFKRYQIQKVWRGERQQRGRFKEFTQADIDVIGDNLAINYDGEIINTLYSTLSEIFSFLDIDKGVEVHINNKKFIDGICEKFDISGESKINLYSLLDSFYKITKQDFKYSLQKLTGKHFDKVNKLLNTNIEDFSDDTFDGINELKIVYNSLINKGVKTVFDPYITRGLDYYTGTVFETFISEYFDFGSVCSGGRYDNLVDDIRKVANEGKEQLNTKKYSGVGGSIGLSRLFARLEEAGFINKKIALTKTIIFNTEESNIEYREKIGEILRNNGISTDIYYQNDKIGKQFSYAENKNISFGIFAGLDEEEKGEIIVKNLDTREQKSVSINNLVSYMKSKLEIILN